MVSFWGQARLTIAAAFYKFLVPNSRRGHCISTLHISVALLFACIVPDLGNENSQFSTFDSFFSNEL